MSTTKRALITGSAGQDGFYLSQLLVEKGYEVTGIDKSEGDISDHTFVETLVKQGFDEIYNLAGIATVASPWENPILVGEVVGMAPLYFLEAIRKTSPTTKFFQASSAEMFGNPLETPQSETTPFHPVTPYGAAKLFAHLMVEQYRSQGIFAVSGILFNHESPRRAETFVTRKITATLARIKKGSGEKLKLGALDAERDWSYAGDIVRAMQMSLQAPTAGTYVFASGAVHTVKDFAEEAAKHLDLSLDGVIEVDSAFQRPADIKTRRGNIEKTTRELGWKPEVSFEELVAMMVDADMKS